MAEPPACSPFSVPVSQDPSPMTLQVPLGGFDVDWLGVSTPGRVGGGGGDPLSPVICFVIKEFPGLCVCHKNSRGGGMSHIPSWEDGEWEEEAGGAVRNSGGLCPHPSACLCHTHTHKPRARHSTSQHTHTHTPGPDIQSPSPHL